MSNFFDWLCGFAEQLKQLFPSGKEPAICGHSHVNVNIERA